MSVEVVEWRSDWSADFAALAEQISDAVGARLVRIDHIGSTSIPGMAAKDVIDVQVIVGHLDDPELAAGLLGAGFTRSPGAHNSRDHVPAGWAGDASDWDKLVFGPPAGQRLGNVHIRRLGRPNERYALLFRDFLTHDRAAGAAWAMFKMRLAAAVSTREEYGQVKDPATDVLMAAAERWADETGWQPPRGSGSRPDDR